MTAFSQFSDNFNDGLFQSGTNSNRKVNWTGDAAEFVVNDALQLQLYSENNHSPSQLKTQSSIVANTGWEFYVKMNFNPTASNYSKVYLVSDEVDLTGELDGLFIRIGYTDKNICLIQSQKGSNNKTLIAGEKKRLDLSSVALNVKATLDDTGKFSLYSRLDGESAFTLEGSCDLPNIPVSNWFGVVCTFTSSRNKHFFFDDFVVKPLDGEDPGTDPGTDPDPVYDFPQEGDIVFSEIMANPGTGSENPEYVELYNTTGKTFQLKDCLYFYGDKSYALPEKTIAPHSYFVLCKTASTAWFGDNVNANGVASFPTLANSGKLLMLGNTQNGLISWFEYSDTMYSDNTKKAGGWSLEAIDLSNVSNTAGNWSASTDASGGTPGKQNSIQAANPDVTHPVILSTALLDGNKMGITFSKPMNRNLLLATESYAITDTHYRITGLEAGYPQATTVTVQLNQFPPQGELIELSLSGVKDRSGNGLEGDHSVFIGNAFEAGPSDVIINEILFNPPTGGNEYVELYNRSDKVLDLRYLSITSRKPSDGSFNKAYPLTTLPLFLYPQEYVVVTKDRNLVCGFFTCHEESFFTEPQAMPSLANTSGCAVILNNITNEIVDQFYYNESMHSKGISTKKGVSLERIRFDVPADEPTNWASASGISGNGTPGYVNSQHSEGVGIENPSKNSITIEYPAWGDDSYGIRYQLDKPGYNCRLFIYDAIGRRMNTVANNELLGSQGVIYWNGQGNSGRKLTAGIYIVYLEVFDMSGNVHKFKTPVVVR
ncbi:hypothetical protein FACS189421_10530 [Bacteroidia bacterium]|nr:hypothetical protein FACS189421_10530 [Bacteroidia bacterium]GHT47681.1 hypothetical protein FACS189440_08930 [Bacteroidia bacterium]